MEKFLAIILSAVFIFSCSSMQTNRPPAYRDAPDVKVTVYSGAKNIAYKKFVIGEIDLGKGVMPTGLAVNGDELYVGDLKNSQYLVVDMKTGKVIEKFAADGFFPTGLQFDGETLYTSDMFINRIERRSPGKKTKKSPLPYYANWLWGVATGKTEIFALDALKKRIIRIDKTDGSEIAHFKAPGKRPTGLAFDGKYLWSADVNNREIYMLEPKDGFVVQRIPSPALFPAGLALYKNEILVSDLQTGKIYRLKKFADNPFIEDNQKQFTIIFRIDHQATGSGKVKNIVSRFAVPKTRPGQKIFEVTYDPTPDAFEKDKWGQEFAVFKIPELKGGENKRVTMTVKAEVARVSFQLDPENITTVDAGENENLKKYLGDGRKYGLDSDVVKQKALKAAGEEKNYYMRARRIYEALTDSIKYDRSGGWGAAPTVLERGTGSCSEYTFSLVALFRAAGIPARYVGAYVNRAKQGGLDFVFHRWAEVWMGERAGWVPVDANAGSSRQPEVRGAAFGSLNNRVLVTTVSGGESDLIDWDYNYHTDYEIKGDAALETFPLAIWKKHLRD